MNWLQFLLALASDAPHLLQAGAQLANDAGHGKGSVAKVATVTGDVTALAGELVADAKGAAIAGTAGTGNGQ